MTGCGENGGVGSDSKDRTEECREQHDWW